MAVNAPIDERGSAAEAALWSKLFWRVVPMLVLLMMLNYIDRAFWSFATSFLEQRAAAVGIGLLSCGGSIGGFLATYLLGVFRTQFGSFEVGLYFMAGVALVGALLMWVAARNVENTLMGEA